MDYRSFVFFFFPLFIFLVEQSTAKPVQSIESTLSHCAACHGSDGNASVNNAWPKLAGQNTVYLFKALKDFRLGVKCGRYQAVMNAMLVSLSEEEILAIIDYYAALPGSIDAAQMDLIPLGQRLYRGGDSTKGIPACLACHGPAGLGNPTAGFPRLSGQHAAYVALQLKAFRAGKRRDDRHQMMSVITKKMSDTDIKAVASYISGLY